MKPILASLKSTCRVMTVAMVLTLTLPMAAMATDPGERSSSGARVTVAPVVEFLWGSTNYELDANAFDPSAPDSVSRIRSQLDFPLDIVMVGGRMTYRFGGEDPTWSVDVDFRVSVTDPSELMTDEERKSVV